MKILSHPGSRIKCGISASHLGSYAVLMHPTWDFRWELCIPPEILVGTCISHLGYFIPPRSIYFHSWAWKESMQRSSVYLTYEVTVEFVLNFWSGITFSTQIILSVHFKHPHMSYHSVINQVNIKVIQMYGWQIVRCYKRSTHFITSKCTNKLFYWMTA